MKKQCISENRGHKAVGAVLCLLIALLFLCTLIHLSFATRGDAAAYTDAGSKTYCVVEPISPISEKPGLRYKVIKTGEGLYILDDHPDILGVVVYGNHIDVEPLQGQWARLIFDGKEIGYVHKKALQEVPAYRRTNTSYYWAKRDAPELYLQPERLPIDGYGFSMLRGEVASCDGEYTSDDGTEWLLLSFATAEYTGDSGVGARFAWAKADDFLRLETYDPNHTLIFPGNIPPRIRGSLRMESGGYSFEREWLERLSKHGFLIDPEPLILDDTVIDDMADLYGGTAEYVPQFITTDMFFHAYHLIFDRMLQNLELNFFAPMLEKMLKAALFELDRLERENPRMRTGRFAVTTRDLFSLPLALLSDPLSEPENALSPQASLEYRKIISASERTTSVITGSIEDYTRYKPRSHYTISPAFERYFRAMTFIGGATIPLKVDNRERELHNASVIALTCTILGSNPAGTFYRPFTEALRFMMGNSDDNSVEEYLDVARSFHVGNGAPLFDREKVEGLHQALLSKSRAPRIIDMPSSRTGMSTAEREQEATGFRIIGRRFAPDAYIFARLTSPAVGTNEEPRNMPDPADVMTVLGSSAARLITNQYAEMYKGYAFNRRVLEREIPRLFSSEDGENSYTGWLKVLSAYLADSGSSQFFYRNGGKWEWKKLLSASASWTEFKHDTVLYAKQSGVEMGSGGEWTPGEFAPPRPRGYVEPEPQTFKAMLDAITRLQALLTTVKDAKESPYRGEEYEHKLAVFGRLCREAYEVALKEVRDQPLTTEDFSVIEDLASSFTASLLLPEGVDYPNDEKDRDMRKMAIVTDVATDYFSNKVLHTATGTPRRLFVFVSDKSGGPRVTVGYVYSYYEFLRDLERGRMTDEEWKSVVYSADEQPTLRHLLPRWHVDLAF